MQLRTKLLALITILALSAVICDGVMYGGLLHRSEVDKELSRLQVVRLSVEKLNSLTYAVVADSRGVYMRTEIAQASPFLQGLTRFLDEMQSTKNALLSDPSKRDYTVISSTLTETQTFIDFRRELVRLAREQSLEAAKIYGDNDANRQVRQRLNSALQVAVAKLGELQTEEMNKMAAEEKWSVWILFGAMGLSVAGLIGGIFVAERGFYRPIHSLRASMLDLANGATNLTIPGSKRKDEIGEMAQAVVVFQQSAIANARLTREAENERARREEAQSKTLEEQQRRIAEERSRAEVDLARQAQERENQLQREVADRKRADDERMARQKSAEDAILKERELVVGSIGAGLTKLAAKDLTYRMDVELPESYRKLKSDFNEAIEQIEIAMKMVANNSNAVHSGTAEISTAVDELSRRTEQQAASLEQTVAALGEITAQVAESAKGAVKANRLVSLAKTSADDGGNVVRNAVGAMKRIEDSSRQISQIIGTIDEIAFQTSLLALNAGVEAARAGEAGRGFAVVASEVRALAKRSADAAKEIKTLIQASSMQVNEGVTLVAQAGEALNAIVAGVAEINGIVAIVASSAQDQSAALVEVNTAVNQMGQLTQQNAAMVEETTAATRSLAEQADELTGLISQFKVANSSRSKLESFPRRKAA